MITAVVFDVGSVLVGPMYRPSVNALADLLKMNRQELFEAIKPEFSGAVMCGGMPESEHFRNACVKYHFPEADALDALQKACTPQPIEDSWKIVEELAPKVNLAVLSDMGKEWTANLRRTLPFDAYFPVQVFSYARGFRKPDPQSYQYVLRALNCPPKEVLFIDDKDYNVEAAQQEGMQGHVFVDAAGLRAELVRLGVL